MVTYLHDTCCRKKEAMFSSSTRDLAPSKGTPRMYEPYCRTTAFSRGQSEQDRPLLSSSNIAHEDLKEYSRVQSFRSDLGDPENMPKYEPEELRFAKSIRKNEDRSLSSSNLRRNHYRDNELGQPEVRDRVKSSSIDHQANRSMRPEEQMNDQNYWEKPQNQQISYLSVKKNYKTQKDYEEQQHSPKNRFNFQRNSDLKDPHRLPKLNYQKKVLQNPNLKTNIPVSNPQSQQHQISQNQETPQHISNNQRQAARHVRTCDSQSFVMPPAEPSSEPTDRPPHDQSSRTLNQIRYYMIVGMLCAEIETLFSILGENVESRYWKYRKTKDRSVEIVLDNIAADLLAISHFDLSAKQQKSGRFLFPDISQDIERWKRAYRSLQRRSVRTNSDLVMQILEFVLNGLQEQRISSLPCHLEDLIFPPEIVEKADRDMVGGRQHEFMMLVSKTQRVAQLDQERLSQYGHLRPEDIRFTYDPI